MSESESRRRNKATRVSTAGVNPTGMMSPKSTAASDRRRKAK